MWNLFDIAVFCAGFAACWFTKDWITKQALGAKNFAAKLEAKAAQLRALV
jgi:hypothetical protein